MYELSVDGMTCGGCANSVKKSVQRIDRNAMIEVDLAGKTVRVESVKGIDAIEAAITAAGYPVLARRADHHERRSNS
jgi:copper chaperone CopZ